MTAPPNPRRWLGLAWLAASLPALAAPDATPNGATPLPNGPQAQADSGLGMFALYEENRRLGVPNLITLDLLLQAYSQIRLSEQSRYEETVLAPLLAEWLQALLAKIPANAKAGSADAANRQLLSVIQTLLTGQDNADPAAQAEVKLVLDAAGIAPSALWGYRLDYSQFKPRGAYTRGEAMSRFFRAFRYANSIRLSVVPSQATGVDAASADRQAAQIAAFTRLLHDGSVAPLQQRLRESAGWLYGPANGPGWRDADAALQGTGENDAPPAIRQKLLDQVRKTGQQPRVITDIVDVGLLEPGVSLADAVTGWRLLEQRISPDAQLFQGLVFPATGPYLGGEPKPFGLGQAGGQPVKTFPTLYEWLAALAPGSLSSQLEKAGETRFKGYPEAFAKARKEAGKTDGLAGLQTALLKDYLTTPAAPPATAAAFWTQQRYIGLLYSAQSSTPTAKGGFALLAQARPGAAIDIPPAQLQRLLAVVDGHLRQQPSDKWAAFKDLLVRCEKLAQPSGKTKLSAEDEQFLNELDQSLSRLTGGPDQPWVVDIHSDQNSAQVVEEATGYALEAFARKGSTLARGGRLSHYEFKQPLANRLTDADWQSWLHAQSPGRTRAEAAKKLDNRLAVAAIRARSGGTPDKPVRSVVILTQGSDTKALTQKLSAAGFKVTTTQANRAFGELPARAIDTLAGWPEVWSLAEEHAEFVPLKTGSQNPPAQPPVPANPAQPKNPADTMD